MLTYFEKFNSHCNYAKHNNYYCAITLQYVNFILVSTISLSTVVLNSRDC